MNLYSLKINEKATISNINIHGDERKRLFDLGFIPGEDIEKVFLSVFNNPVCYKIKDVLIALRNEDAIKIEVIHE